MELYSCTVVIAQHTPQLMYRGGDQIFLLKYQDNI